MTVAQETFLIETVRPISINYDKGTTVIRCQGSLNGKAKNLLLTGKRVCFQLFWQSVRGRSNEQA